MTEQKLDKGTKCCLTCQYWGGYRKFDGLGLYTYDADDKDGICNQVAWKGFGGATVNCFHECSDYTPLH